MFSLIFSRKERQLPGTALQPRYNAAVWAVFIRSRLDGLRMREAFPWLPRRLSNYLSERECPLDCYLETQFMMVRRGLP